MSPQETPEPTVTIITSVTDGYDTLKRTLPQIGVSVEWIAVTDGREEREPDHGWTVFPVNDTYWGEEDLSHPNRIAKIVKCKPYLYASSPYTIWIDASYRVTSPLFAFEAIGFANPIAQFVHPWRSCIFEEAAASVNLPRYEGQAEKIREQSAEYSQIGHPPNWGLWATGVIVRKYTSEVQEMGLQWLREIRRHSYQDQVSQPVSLRMCDLRPNPLPGNHIQNPWLKYEGSARHG